MGQGSPFSRRRSIVTLAGLVLAVAVASADAQTLTLRYRWAKGDVRTYRVTIKTENHISGLPGAGDVTVSQTMAQVLRIAATDVAADGTATLSQTFQSVRMETASPLGSMLVDTSVPVNDQNPDQNPMTQAMRGMLGAMVGESVTVVVAPDGAVQKVTGASHIADKMTAVMSGNPGVAAAGQAIRTMLSDEALKSTLEQSFSRLPADPVKVGDTWRGQLAMGNQAIGRIAGNSTFTLKAIEGSPDGPLARVAVALSLKQEVVPPPSGPAGTVMKLGTSGGLGEILFDVAKGQIQRSTMKSDMTSTLTGSGPDGVPATMQNQTTTTMTMELVEK